VPSPAAEPVPSSVLDLPLVQRVLSAQQSVDAGAAVPPAATPATPTTHGPGHAPAHAPVAPAAAAGPTTPEGDEVVRAWVVSELQLPGEPGAALTMRILDLTSEQERRQAQPGPTPTRSADSDVWAPPQFARPA
jgi:hypothetical protein